MICCARALCLIAASTAFLRPRGAAGAQQSVAARVDTLRTTVDGHRIALFASGSGSGPTIVMEAGGGSSHTSWGALPQELARFARVVAYDRAGYGLSEACGRPRSARVVSEELRAALSAAGIAPPFLLVGWSLGGSFARVFAATYPDDVAGVVLVDPAPEGFYARAAREQPALWQPLLAEQEKRVAASAPGHRGEWAAWDSSMAQARASDPTLRAPVILLTATRSEDTLQSIWIDEHRRWAARTPVVRQILVDGAGHAIHRDQPQMVIAAVRELWDAARGGVGRPRRE